MTENLRIERFKTFYFDKHLKGHSFESIRGEFLKHFRDATPVERDCTEAWFNERLVEMRNSAENRKYAPGFDLTAARVADQSFRARLIEVLSRGGHTEGSGHVWRARSLTDWLFRGDLVVKILRQRDDRADSLPTAMRGSFLLRELQMLRGISHPNCVRVYDGFFSREGAPWLAIEFVNGCDLREWKIRYMNDGVPLRMALAICGFFADVLQTIATKAEQTDAAYEDTPNRSEVSFIHGDIKPSNIVGFPKDGRSISIDSIKLCDFGTSLIESAVDSREGIRFRQYGTCGYMAPEQFGCDVPRTAAIDVFGFGMLLLSLLTPVDQETYRTLVGSDASWDQLHDLWFARDSGSRAPFENLLRSKSREPLPSSEEIREVYRQLRLFDLVDKLLPDNDQETLILRRIVKLCVEIDPNHRIQSPGAMAMAFATWLRNEEIDFSKLAREGSVISQEVRKTTFAQFLDRDRRLFLRATRWRQSDDLVAVGTCTWVPVSFFLFVCASCNVFLRHINATSNILSYVAIGIGITGLALQGLRLGFEATRIGKLGEVVSSLFLGRLLSAWLLFIFFAFAFFVSRQWIGESDVDAQISRKADIAQMLLSASLLAGYTCGRDGSINAAIAVGLTSASLLTIYCYCFPKATAYDWLTDIAFFLMYAVFLGLFAFETYFMQVLLNLRPKTVQALFASENGRRSVFDSVIASEGGGSDRRHAT